MENQTLDQKRIALSTTYSNCKKQLDLMNEVFIKSITGQQFRFYQGSNKYWYARPETAFKAITRSKRLFKLYSEAKALHKLMVSANIELDTILERLEALENTSLKLVG